MENGNLSVNRPALNYTNYKRKASIQMIIIGLIMSLPITIFNFIDDKYYNHTLGNNETLGFLVILIMGFCIFGFVLTAIGSFKIRGIIGVSAMTCLAINVYLINRINQSDDPFTPILFYGVIFSIIIMIIIDLISRKYFIDRK